MVSDCDRSRGSWINRVRGVTGDDRQVRGGEMDCGPRTPRCLTRDQVLIPVTIIQHFLGYQLVGLLIARVLIVDHPFHPLVLTGRVVLVGQMDG